MCIRDRDTSPPLMTKFTPPHSTSAVKMRNPQIYYYPDEQNSATCHHTPFTMSLPRPLGTIQPKSSLRKRRNPKSSIYPVHNTPNIPQSRSLKGAWCGLLCATSSYITREYRENSETKSPQENLYNLMHPSPFGSGYLTTNLTIYITNGLLYIIYTTLVRITKSNVPLKKVVQILKNFLIFRQKH